MISHHQGKKPDQRTSMKIPTFSALICVYHPSIHVQATRVATGVAPQAPRLACQGVWKARAMASRGETKSGDVQMFSWESCRIPTIENHRKMVVEWDFMGFTIDVPNFRLDNIISMEFLMEFLGRGIGFTLNWIP